MKFRSRGRAHLEKLLGHAEEVVRVSPADVLVLIGVDDSDGAAPFGPLLGLLNEAGIEAAGVVALTKGMTVDSIDMPELVRMYELAGTVEQGADARESASIGIDVPVACTRCAETISVTVSVRIADDGEQMVARATASQTDLGLHQVLCTGGARQDR